MKIRLPGILRYGEPTPNEGEREATESTLRERGGRWAKAARDKTGAAVRKAVNCAKPVVAEASAAAVEKAAQIASSASGAAASASEAIGDAANGAKRRVLGVFNVGYRWYWRIKYGSIALGVLVVAALIAYIINTAASFGAFG